MSAAGVPSVDLALVKAGKTVGELTLAAEKQGDKMFIEELLVKGDLSGKLEYEGRTVEIESVDEIIGLLVDTSGARGPVWRGVRLRIVKN
jgi:hypothetical protein